MEEPHFIKCEPLHVEDSIHCESNVPLCSDITREVKDEPNITLACDVEDLKMEMVKEECEIQELSKETHDEEGDSYERTSNEQRGETVEREGISCDPCCSSVINGIICKFNSEQNSKLLPVLDEHVLDCKNASELPAHFHSGIVVISLHDGGNVYSCDGLRTHKLRPCKRPSSYSCDICGRTFTSKKYIKQHVATHMGQKPFSCTICKANFRRRGQLNYHTFIHTKERPFVCSTCGKGFIKRSDMRRHEISHTQTKPFACTTCGKTFKWSIGLDKHILNHKVPVLFPCSMCSRSFETKEVLKRHKVTHLKEHHVCSICSKAFLKLSGLLRHQVIHTRKT